jgi:hypothetical protein
LPIAYRMKCLGLLLLVATAAISAQREYVIVRKGGKEYHRPGCEQIRGAKDVVAMIREEAEQRRIRPHAACASQKSAGGTQDALQPPKPVFVFVDGGNYYHREKCAKLGSDPKRVEVEAAAKRQWPCPTCKPPIRKRNPER